MICLRCKKEHEGKYGGGKYCSRSCANSRIRSTETKKKISEALKGRISANKGLKIIPRVNKICPTCKISFESLQSSKVLYCSGKCNPSWGGYREGSGRAKTGYYKGIYCGSTYELVWVIYQLDHNRPFERFKGVIQNEFLRYYPDFVYENVIYEMKGYEDDILVVAKTKLAESNGYIVKVLRKKDLETEFEWVKQKYSFKRLEELYDNYKPKFVYKCTNCGVDISKNKTTNTTTVFCGQKCSGHYRAKIKHKIILL